MKNILCFGDSNTFGCNPSNFTRYSENERWSGILKEKFKNQFEVFEEGANNRNGFVDNPDGDFYSSQKYLPELLNKLGNLDIIILAVGTNDLQFQYNITFEQIEKGLENLIVISKKYSENIIVILPVILNDNIFNGYFRTMFDKSSIEKSKNVEKIYRKVVQKYNCRIFDINKFAKPSEIDGLHYDEHSHSIIANKFLEIFKDKMI